MLSGRLAALSERDFRNVFFAGAVSRLGDYMMPVALAFAVLDLTGSVSDLGFVLTASTVPLVVFLLVGGVVADRVSRRKVMVATDLARLASNATLATLILSGHARLWHFLVLQGVHGAASAFFQPASTGIVPQVVAAESLQEANALRGLTDSLGGIAGPALSGALVVAASPGWAIAFNAATFAVSAAFLVRVHAPALERATARVTFLDDLVHGWREFSSRTWLWVIVAQFSLLHLSPIPAFFALGAVVSKRSLGGAGAWSVILAALAVGTFVGGLLMLRLRVKRPLLVATIAQGAWALPLAALAMRLDVGLIAAGAFVAGVGGACFGALWTTTLQREVPREALSRVSAYDWFGSVATLPIGFALVGPVAHSIGIPRTLWNGTFVLLGSAVAVLAVSDVRRER